MKILGVVLSLFCFLFYSTTMHAQGCGQSPIEEMSIDCCGLGDFVPDLHCDPPGNPTMFCYEGYGECCGVDYGSANTAPDDSCACQPQSCPTNEYWSPAACACVGGGSPIIIDTTGEGFHLTPAENGVTFDIAGDGHPILLAWTAANSRNAFLALDRNHNGQIDNGKELFGNFTFQPESSNPNGFLALAVFDKLANGGNGDGIIDKQDAVFSSLRLWIDENHDGISQSNELHTLPELGVSSLALTYRESRRTDEFGNQFRYKAVVNPESGNVESGGGRWAYDVFFAVAVDTQASHISLDEGIDFGKQSSNQGRRRHGCPRVNTGGVQ